MYKKVKLGLKTILILFCLNHGLIFSQTWLCWEFMLSNVKTIPEYPVPGENVKVSYTIFSFVGSINMSNQLAQSGNDFQVENCLVVGATAITDTHQDTIDLGFLAEGIYTLTVKIKGDYMGPPYCDSYGDSVWLDTSFAVLSTNEISELNEQESVSIFPNPVNEYLFFRINQQGHAEYIITDFSGKIISEGQTEAAAADQAQVRVDYLPAGLYLFGVLINGEWLYKRFYKT